MKRQPVVIRPHDRKPEPRMFGRASYASMAVIVLLAVGAAATYEPMPPVRGQAKASQPIRHTPEEQRRLTALFEQLEREDRAEAGLRPRKPPTARQLAHDAAVEQGLPPSLYHGLLMTENGGRLTANRSRKGAIGAAQLMPATAKELGVNPRDAGQNIKAGARYLKRWVDRYGSETLALVAYNMGPGATDRWLAKGGRWDRLPKETRDYVSKVSVNAALAGRQFQVASDDQ